MAWPGNVWTDGSCQHLRWENGLPCGRPTHRQSIWCPLCIKEEWPACRTKKPSHVIAWKCLTPNPDQPAGFLGSLNCPYALGQETFGIGPSNFLFSPLGCAREGEKGYGNRWGAFLLYLPYCQLKVEQIIEYYGPARLLNVIEPKCTSEEATEWLNNLQTYGGRVNQIEAALKPFVPQGTTLTPVSKWNKKTGMRYFELANPVHPFYLPRVTEVTPEHIKLLEEWASVEASVWASVRDSVGDSVGVSVWDSVGVSVWDSVGASVRDSVGDSVGAYIGWHFPNIKQWTNVQRTKGDYPFQAAIDLWLSGIVPSFNGIIWRLNVSCGNGRCRIGWEGLL